MKGRKYRPSNGTEGDYFMCEHCYQCIHDHPNPDLKPKCEIIVLTMCLDLNDKDYPAEWTYDENNKPTCTKFLKWDWDNDGDPNDPDNPKAPVPEDPNQLCLPFIFEEIGIQELVTQS